MPRSAFRARKRREFRSRQQSSSDDGDNDSGSDGPVSTRIPGDGGGGNDTGDNSNADSGASSDATGGGSDQQTGSNTDSQDSEPTGTLRGRRKERRSDDGGGGGGNSGPSSTRVPGDGEDSPTTVEETSDPARPTTQGKQEQSSPTSDASGDRTPGAGSDSGGQQTGGGGGGQPNAGVESIVSASAPPGGESDVPQGIEMQSGKTASPLPEKAKQLESQLLNRAGLESRGAVRVKAVDTDSDPRPDKLKGRLTDLGRARLAEQQVADQIAFMSADQFQSEATGSGLQVQGTTPEARERLETLRQLKAAQAAQPGQQEIVGVKGVDDAFRIKSDSGQTQTVAFSEQAQQELANRGQSATGETSVGRQSQGADTDEILNQRFGMDPPSRSSESAGEQAVSTLVERSEHATGLDVPGERSLFQQAAERRQQRPESDEFGLAAGDAVGQQIAQGAADVADALASTEVSELVSDVATLNLPGPTAQGRIRARLADATNSRQTPAGGSIRSSLSAAGLDQTIPEIGEEVLAADFRRPVGREIQAAAIDAGGTARTVTTPDASLSAEGLTRGAVEGPVTLVGSIPQTVNLAADTAVEGGEATTEAARQRDTQPVEEFGGFMAASGVGAVENVATATARRPSQTVGALGASVLATGGLIRGARSLGGPRTGRAVSVAVQPGEEAAIAAGRAGLIGSRTASLVPGVSRGSVEGASETEDSTGTSQSRLGAVRQRLEDQNVVDAQVRRSADAPLLDVNIRSGGSTDNALVNPPRAAQDLAAVREAASGAATALRTRFSEFNQPEVRVTDEGTLRPTNTLADPPRAGDDLRAVGERARRVGEAGREVVREAASKARERFSAFNQPETRVTDQGVLRPTNPLADPRGVGQDVDALRRGAATAAATLRSAEATARERLSEFNQPELRVTDEGTLRPTNTLADPPRAREELLSLRDRVGDLAGTAETRLESFAETEASNQLQSPPDPADQLRTVRRSVTRFGSVAGARLEAFNEPESPNRFQEPVSPVRPLQNLADRAREVSVRIDIGQPTGDTTTVDAAELGEAFRDVGVDVQGELPDLSEQIDAQAQAESGGTVGDTAAVTDASTSGTGQLQTVVRAGRSEQTGTAEPERTGIGTEFDLRGPRRSAEPTLNAVSPMDASATQLPISGPTEAVNQRMREAAEVIQPTLEDVGVENTLRNEIRLGQEPGTEVGFEPGLDIRTDVGLETEIRLDTQVETRPETRPEVRPELRTEVGLETRPETPNEREPRLDPVEVDPTYDSDIFQQEWVNPVADAQQALEEVFQGVSR